MLHFCIQTFYLHYYDTIHVYTFIFTYTLYTYYLFNTHTTYNIYIYIYIQLIMIAAVSFSYAAPLDKMHPLRPLKSLFHPAIILSILGTR